MSLLRSIVLRPVLRVFQVYETSLVRRPVLTQLAVGTALVGLGDAAAQHLIEKKDLINHDWERTGNMVLLRGVIHSTMIIYWYRFLQAKVPMTGYGMYTRLGVHLTLDQCLFGPSNVLFFFVASGILEGKTKSQIQQKLHDRLWETIVSALVLWVPFSFIGFRFIPLNSRMVAGQVVAIGWNCYMSYQNARDQDKQDSHSDKSITAGARDEGLAAGPSRTR